MKFYQHIGLTASSLLMFASSANALLHNQDVYIQGSACVGIDCVNNSSFGFDTIKLRENNLRIKFDDTSTAASFPRNDWQLTANDSANGGTSKFSIDDVTGGRTPFTVEANAPTNSLYMEDSGDIGFGTSNPVVNLHTVDGDTPTLRLEQDGSSGFTPQTWDMAGNETNFFIRDVTNGSKLPFRIRPNAPTSSIDVAADGDVGLGTASPDANIDIERSGGRVTMRMGDSTSGDNWQIVMDDDADANAGLSFTRDGTGVREFRISPTGALFVNGAAHTVPDYVFDPSYDLMPLSEIESFILENQHLPNVPSAADIKQNGLPLTGMQMKLLEKVEELTLHTISQEKMIASQNGMIVKLAKRLEELETRVVTD